MDIEHDAVTNVEDAKKQLASTSYSCVLLDLCIPAKPDRGGASEDFGVILLKEIQRIKKPFPPQVYMMTAHTAQGFDLAAKLLRLGVRDFISKPFAALLSQQPPRSTRTEPSRGPTGSLSAPLG
ncbi:MAG: response regulator [Planctomycetota bacterium]